MLALQVQGGPGAAEVRVDPRDLGPVLDCAEIVACRAAARVLGLLPDQDQRLFLLLLNRPGIVFSGSNGIGTEAYIYFGRYRAELFYARSACTVRLHPIRIVLASRGNSRP
jgi:hypothetical protein